ncbi:MAG: CYTH domain-containing protein [Candidatus Nanoarchaeia archaeon]|nr:CYTH domain-containing protein [Candidatus Nanoarchaeia archaeon]
MLYELEGKFEVEELEQIKKNILSTSSLLEKVVEYNMIFPLKNKRYIRVRQQNEKKFFWTYKGKPKTSEFNKRLEIEFRIPEFIYDMFFKTTAHIYYEKEREIYKHPQGKIFLDQISSRDKPLMNFVEIEAKSEENISFIKKQLNILSPNITQPYWLLIESKYL